MSQTSLGDVLDESPRREIRQWGGHRGPRTGRTDHWWALPLVTALVLGGFVIYGTVPNLTAIGSAVYNDVSAAQLSEGTIVRHGGANNWLLPRVSNTGGSFAQQNSIGPSTPIPFATGDQIGWAINCAVQRTAPGVFDAAELLPSIVVDEPKPRRRRS